MTLDNTVSFLNHINDKLFIRHNQSKSELQCSEKIVSAVVSVFIQNAVKKDDLVTLYLRVRI